MFPISTFSILATKTISECGLLTENIAYVKKTANKHLRNHTEDIYKIPPF